MNVNFLGLLKNIRFCNSPIHSKRQREKFFIYLVICFFSYFFFFSLKSQLGNQKVTAPVMEVNASQTHRQTATEASPLPLPPPVVPVNRASFSPDSGTHLVPYSLPALDDFLPSRFYKTPALSQFSYKCPYLASESIIHRNETASVSTDSAMSECSSRTVSESSTAILDELQTCSYDTTDCSETPSPTLSQMSAVSDGTTLTNTAATSHVIMLPFFLLRFVQTGCQRGKEFKLVCYPVTLC